MNTKTFAKCFAILAVLGLIAACNGNNTPGPDPSTTAINAQPTDQSVVVGTTATFNVVASNATGYQWQRSTNNGTTFTDISGATAASHTTAATTLSDSGTQYRVLVSGASNSVTSSAATLTVTATALTVSVALPKTGQTACYDSSFPPVTAACNTAGIPPGQDGALQTGVGEPAPRFVVGTGVGTTDQCVTDNLTGLMWTKNANLPGAAQTWQQALDYANNLTLCGFTDWRLANPNELSSLINFGVASNAGRLNGLDFMNVQADYYWLSSSLAANPAYAWTFNMNTGVMIIGGASGSKSSSHYVWPVRAGQ